MTHPTDVAEEEEPVTVVEEKKDNDNDNNKESDAQVRRNCWRCRLVVVVSVMYTHVTLCFDLFFVSIVVVRTLNYTLKRPVTSPHR